MPAQPHSQNHAAAITRPDFGMTDFSRDAAVK